MAVADRRVRVIPAPPGVRARSRPVSLDALIAVALAVLAFVLYAATLAPDVLEGDSGEFQYVLPTLGVAHPTGYPLYTILGWAWTHLLPIGAMAWRVNLFSAAASALAVGLVYLVARSLSGSRPAALLAAALLAGQRTVWAEAVVASVYPLNLALVALVLWAAFRPSSVVFLGAAVGLALAHHRTALFLLPGLVVVGLPGVWAAVHREGRRAFGPLGVAGALAVALPGLLHLYVPLRASQVPTYGYVLGNVGGWLTGSDFAGQLSAVDWPAQLVRLGGTLVAELGPLWLALTGLGFVLLVRRHRAGGLGLGLTVLVYVFFAMAYRHGDPSAPVANLRVYILPVYLIAALLAAEGTAGLAHVAARAHPRASAAVAGLALVLVGLPPLAWNLARVDMHTNTSVAQYARARLGAGLEPAAALIGQWDDITPLWYLQRVEGLRADVDIADAPLLSEAWTARALDLARRGRTVYIQGPLSRFAGPVRVSRVADEVPYAPRTDRDFGDARTAPLYRIVAGDARASPAPGGGPFQVRDATVIDGTGRALANGEPLTGDRRFAVEIHWQVAAAPDADYAFSLRLVDARGEVWAQADKPANDFYYAYFPTRRWPAGQPVWDRYAMRLAPGTPAGEYQLEVTPYLPGGGTLASIRVGALTVGRVETAEGELPVEKRERSPFGGATFLGREALPERTYLPGERVRLVLYFAPGDAPAGGELRLGTERVRFSVPAGGAIVRLVVAAAVPAEASGEMPLTLESPPATLSLGAIRVRPPERLMTLPAEARPLGARVGDLAELAGYRVERAEPVGAGSAVRVTLYWRALRSDRRDIQAFVHLADADERIWAQADAVPGGRPAAGWTAGEIVADRHVLRWKVAPPAGVYRLWAGLYDAATGERLTTGSDLDRIALETVPVEN